MNIYFAGPLFTPYERGYIEWCAERLRDEDFEVFVPHEEALASAPETTGASIFAKDWAGLEGADAMLAILDGPTVDDGVACEIGIFHALMRSDPRRKGIVGLLTDMRGTRGGGHAVNPFVAGGIEASGGAVVGTLDDAVARLRAWRDT
jgi:Nucleoside 2-deoxyribosyltransferase